MSSAATGANVKARQVKLLQVLGPLANDIRLDGGRRQVAHKIV
jgi:hypothetical protein